jgi:putative ABC transport system permease protein
MRMLRALHVSARGLFTHKMKAALAMSTVAVGVGAVVVTGAIGEAAREEVLRQTENMGTNLLVVRPIQVRHSAARQELQGEVTSLKLDDYQAIIGLARVSTATPGFEDSAINVKAGNHAMAAEIVGTTSAYMAVCRFRLRQGRFLDADDDLSTRRVAILGARVNDTLFGQQNAIGQQIRLRDIPFEIIGVFRAKGVLADGADQDGQVVIPIRTAMQRVFNYRWINKIYLNVRGVTEMDEVRMEVAELLRDRHRLKQGGKPDDFEIQDKTQMLAKRKQLAESLTLLATTLAAASLVVGGVGILALMLMSVKERTTEIGLRMAIGAKSRDILIQFLLEATCIAAGGWLVGMALGTIATVIVAKTTAWRTTISPELVLSTLAVVAMSGLGFGTYPARKASLMLPIQALRVE